LDTYVRVPSGKNHRIVVVNTHIKGVAHFFLQIFMYATYQLKTEILFQFDVVGGTVVAKQSRRTLTGRSIEMLHGDQGKVIGLTSETRKNGY
jgi:hypothetical protein